ncbi:MAG: hypothetical protein RI988_996 [Pseudomonadota bacterium]
MEEGLGGIGVTGSPRQPPADGGLLAEKRALWVGCAISRYEPGKNGLPSEAGMFARIHAALREIATSTTMVAR